MKKKIKVFLMLICISVVFCTNTFAISKNDIIGYVNSQTVCGDTGLFNRYKTTFTRLLKQKKLSETELNTIYSYLKNSVGILNSKGVCKIADLSKLTSEEKNSVYSSLTAGANIITSAPILQFGEENTVENNTDLDDNTNTNTNTNTNVNTNNKVNNVPVQNTNRQENDEGTKVTINAKDNTMDIYENGVLVDKVSMDTQKMTYTGVNIVHVVIVITSIVLFCIALWLFVVLARKHTAKTRFIKNILVSIMICSGVIGVCVGLFSSKIDSLFSIIDLISISNSGEEIKVELNSDKSIKKYPSYGSNYATLKIENLDIENDVFFGDISSLLSLGIGHSTWSDMPTEGGTVIYSGHNREGMLNSLQNIQLGNKIVVDTSYAKCTYQVIKTKVLKDYETDKLTKLDNKETLVLYTCYPFNTYVYTDERFVVYSVLKEIKWK